MVNKKSNFLLLKTIVPGNLIRTLALGKLLRINTRTVLENQQWADIKLLQTLRFKVDLRIYHKENPKFIYSDQRV